MSMFLLLLELFSVLQLTASSSSPAIANPGCKDHCGNVPIPYPFGIGANCYHNKSYEITCDNSFPPPKTFLRKFNLEVIDFYWDGRDPRLNYDYFNRLESSQLLIVKTPLRNVCRSKDSINFSGSPYLFSGKYNVLVMKGCGGRASLRDSWGDFTSGCASICADNTVDTGCFGLGCCQASLYSEYYDDSVGLEYYQLDVDDHETDSSPCDMRVGLIDSRSVNNFSNTTVPTILLWNGPASYAQAHSHSPSNYDNFDCFTYTLEAGYCSCSYPYEGNPYLTNGCQGKLFIPRSSILNSSSSYPVYISRSYLTNWFPFVLVMRECRKCRNRCLRIYDQNYNRYHYHCDKNPLLQWRSVLGFSLGTGLIVFLLGCYWLYRVIKRKREVRRKMDYFKRNGGLLLQQIGSAEGGAQKTKVFPVIELEKATDNFNKNTILGQGGQGTVYKGMLKDGRIVAIKKSKKVDEGQLEQFVNEVVILSQINHRNVVKLLGCCLETEVPLLIYEFVQNGTLYQHIHDASEDFHVTWKMRLQIAAESADAIAYLHSSSSVPIYHRDIKSSNILLDAKFRAKVSDFGTSKSIDIDQTHVTTCVMGTYGYLDPEYFQSNQFTEKSDVYSFGVVLVEFITGKKPICPTKDGGWISLAVEFLLHMENSRLTDILDARIVEEGKEEEFFAVAKLASRCLNMKGKERPSMKAVAMVLDNIRSSNLPSSSDPNIMKDKGVIMEKHSPSSSMNTFFSDIGTGATVSSIEVQKNMAHTL